MFSTNTMPAALAAVAIFGAIPAVAAEHEREDQAEIAAVQNAKVSLIDAIRAAEQRVSGKAIGAGLDDNDGKLRYEVRVLKEDSVYKVMVDAQSGEVAADQARRDDNEEREHTGDDDEED
jgi:uncharacterized membrane protein YkoI